MLTFQLKKLNHKIKSNMSYTLTIIKPDSFKSGNDQLIISRILDSGFSVIDMQIKMLSVDVAEQFYKEHKGKDFYFDLLNFMTSGPIIVLCLKKENAVEDFRKLIGNTDPKEAEKGTIRNVYGTDIAHNAIHGADSDESATREILFWFPYLENKIKN